MSSIEIVPIKNWDPIDEFFSFCWDILGSYFDLMAALFHFRLLTDDIRARSKSQSGLSDEELDKAWHIYDQGHPTHPIGGLRHISSQGAFRDRISEDGRDKILQDHMSIVIIYQAWEHHFRGIIAAWLACNKDDLKFDVMGDVRKLRQGIIHRGGRVENGIEWLNLSKDDLIKLDIPQWTNLFEKVILMCRELKKMKYGQESDPQIGFR